MSLVIKEVRIENFMSYKYSRIPLKPGLNIITGPNGSGKSSILLAISVALGQTYTERGRRLSDLIRRGEDTARVTVVIDNSPKNGKRPIPRLRYNEIYLTRYLRKDGKYWHELNYKFLTKIEVERFLRGIGLNPDNMFIIMHQNMIEEFAFLTPQEKLRLIEDAVGLRKYREGILVAMKRLEYLTSEEERVKEVLSKAEEQFRSIEEKYNRLLKKRELIKSKNNVKAKIAWRLVEDKEKELEIIENKIKDINKRILEINEKNRENNEEIKRIFNEINKTEGLIKEGNINLIYGLRSLWLNYSEHYAGLKVNEYIDKELNEKIRALTEEKKKKKEELKPLVEYALALSQRVYVEENINALKDLLKKVEIKLASYSDVNDDVERIYNSYKSGMKELRKRALLVEENRKKALNELNYRKNIWREKLIGLLSKIRETFSQFIARLNGTGDIRIENIDDIENAGIQILVGFRGTKPTVLDPYTQSGGERTSAIICFLLALQQYIKSPFRAIDEFDVHMDPHNREEIFRLLTSLVNKSPSQYLIITPGMLTLIPENINIIVVNNAGGLSRVSLVK